MAHHPSACTSPPFQALPLRQARHVPNSTDPASRLASIVDEYRDKDNLGVLFDGLRVLAREMSPETLVDLRRRVAIVIYSALRSPGRRA